LLSEQPAHGGEKEQLEWRKRLRPAEIAAAFGLNSKKKIKMTLNWQGALRLWNA
jgi:hypothetical protein